MKKISDAISGLHILELEITSRCNLNCLHCYNRPQKHADLPIGKIREIFLLARENRVSTFVISGGEARMHPDFDKLASFLKNTDKGGMRVILQTNGTMTDSSFIDDAKLFDAVHISFDTSDLVRADSSSNISLAKTLKENGIYSYLFTTLHSGNYKNVDRIAGIASRNGIPIGFNVCLPTEKQGSALAVPVKDFKDLEKKLFGMSQAGKILRYSSPLTAVFSPEKAVGYQGNLGGCVAGIASCVVSFDGQVLACPFFRVPAGNIFSGGLPEIWMESELFNAIRDRRKYDSPCGDCPYISYCGGCRNRALKLGGSILAADPLCHLGKGCLND